MVLQRFLEFAQGIIQQQQAVLERESEDLALLAVRDRDILLVKLEGAFVCVFISSSQPG